jgi:hypothetical protein
VDGSPELVFGEDGGQVDESAGGRGDRDAAPDRLVARVQVAGVAGLDAFNDSTTRSSYLRRRCDSPDQLEQMTRRAPAERGSVAACEHRCHVPRFDARRRMTDLVHALVNADQAPFVESSLNRIAGDIRLQQLLPRRIPPLPRSDSGDHSLRCLVLSAHMTDKAGLLPKFTPAGRLLPCVRGLPPAFRLPSLGPARRLRRGLPVGRLRQGAALRSAPAAGAGTRQPRRPLPA